MQNKQEFASTIGENLSQAPFSVDLFHSISFSDLTLILPFELRMHNFC